MTVVTLGMDRHLPSSPAGGGRLVLCAPPGVRRDVLGELEEAARRAASGDAKAFGELVRATTPKLFRLALRLLGEKAEAEDVLQEAFARAHAALLGGRYSP